MSLSDEIAALRTYPSGASDIFRQQLEMVEAVREQSKGDTQNQVQHSNRGMDRSREFTPVERPSMLKLLARG